MTDAPVTRPSFPYGLCLGLLALAALPASLVMADARHRRSAEVAEAACATVGATLAADRSPLACVMPDGVLRVVPAR